MIKHRSGTDLFPGIQVAPGSDNIKKGGKESDRKQEERKEGTGIRKGGVPQVVNKKIAAPESAAQSTNRKSVSIP